MNLQLAEDGIFPITKDKTGNILPILPASGLNFSGTIQGEGKLNGIPSLFIRLAGCNLHCMWKTTSGTISECDTAYAAYNVRNSFSLSTDDICSIILQNAGSIRHIVITGGEPFIQITPLKELLHKLKSHNFHLTIETNATLFDGYLANDIDFFSMSPKLSASTPEGLSGKKHQALRINLKNIQAFIDHATNFRKDFQLKFVYSCANDIPEIKSILSQLYGWKNEDILLMPLGADADELRSNTHETLQHCIRNGWRYCDRLHISLFGNKHGV